MKRGTFSEDKRPHLPPTAVNSLWWPCDASEEMHEKKKCTRTSGRKQKSSTCGSNYQRNLVRSQASPKGDQYSCSAQLVSGCTEHREHRTGDCSTSPIKENVSTDNSEVLSLKWLLLLNWADLCKLKKNKNQTLKLVVEFKKNVSHIFSHRSGMETWTSHQTKTTLLLR